VSADAGTELVALLGDRVLTGDRTASYQRDQCLLEAGTPAYVVRAAHHDDVVTALKWASRHDVPVVARGAGTGLSGAANAVDGSLVLSTAAINAILEIDPVARTARVQPGVLNGDLDAAAAAHGLAYLPDPGSRAIASIGGNIATNAGGMCCAKYGVTRDHVAALTAVLADGRVLRTGSATRKNVTGLDLTSLLVGSEGTLGVITEATLWLHPRAGATSTVVAHFPDVATAVDAVLTITRHGAPAAAELMDQVTIAAVNDHTAMGIASTGALLLVRLDGPDHDSMAAQTRRVERLAEASGAHEVFATVDEDEGEALMAARRVALTAIERLGAVLLDDVAVPVPRLPDLVNGIDRIAEQHGVRIATFGHAADGNMHPTIVFDPSDPAQERAAHAAFVDLMVLATALGGVLTGEHGIGILKRDYLDLQLDPVARDVMLRVKQALDPASLLNPGRSL
jgi:glycolate oxidase